MKKLHLLLSIVTAWLVVSGCNKEVIKTDVEEPETEYMKIADGTYVGVFSVQYSNMTKTGPVTLELNGGKFTCSGNKDRIPAGGSGYFTYYKETISFADKNVWSCDFDGNLILTGNYNFSIKGNKIQISAAKNGVGQYEYNLEKVI